MKREFNTPQSSLPYSELSHNNYEEIPVNIGLVLTGGGSHGAFEAGVLETIIHHLNRIGKISVVTGTSAGAVNAIALGSGLNTSQPNEAVIRLRSVWDKVKAQGLFLRKDLRFFWDSFLPDNQKWPNLPKLPLNPISIFQSCLPSVTAQFISATVGQITNNWASEVQNGPVKIAINTILEDAKNPGKFEHVILTGKDLTPDGVGASANLKQLGIHFIRDTANPLHLNRRAYDGAYQENGLLNPHLDNSVTDYIMIILHDRRHNKLDKKGAIKHAEIHAHALALASGDSLSPIRLHAIEIESLGGEIGGLSHMNNSSKFNTNAEFIDLLYESGIQAGQKWLDKNVAYVGQSSSYTPYPPALRELQNMSYT